MKWSVKKLTIYLLRLCYTCDYFCFVYFVFCRFTSEVVIVVQSLVGSAAAATVTCIVRHVSMMLAVKYSVHWLHSANRCSIMIWHALVLGKLIPNWTFLFLNFSFFFFILFVCMKTNLNSIERNMLGHVRFLVLLSQPVRYKSKWHFKSGNYFRIEVSSFLNFQPSQKPIQQSKHLFSQQKSLI